MILFWVIFVVVLLFGFVVVYGAPYLPTLRAQANSALDLLDLKPGQTLIELGCGDGRVAKFAASRGLNVIGYELNPILVIIARLHTVRYRRRVRIIWGNYWRIEWPPTDGIFTFLLDKYMNKLDKKITQQYKGRHIKLVSYAFLIPGKQPAKSQNGVHLYHYND